MLAQMMRRTGFLLLFLLAICGGLLIARQVLAPGLDIVWMKNGELRISLQPGEVIHGSVFEFEPFYTGRDNSAREYGSARSDHAAIAMSIGRCYDNYRDPLQWSSATRTVLMFNLNEHFMHSMPFTEAEANTPPPTLNPYHIAAISYSDRISRDRLHFRRELEDNRSMARTYQVLILLIGGLATFAIGVKSMLDDKAPRWLSIGIGVAAILLSASGTGVSSMSSFDGSQGIALRDQRALSQLQQLHWRVTSDVLAQTDLCKAPDTMSREAMKQIDAWKSRLETILDNAVESVSQPGDLGRLPPEAPVKEQPTPAAKPAEPSVNASVGTPGKELHP